MAQTAACVDLYVPNTVTWQDAFQFGVTGDTTWSFAGQSFILEVKASSNDALPLATLSSALGSIVVDDAAKRVLHFNMPKTAIQAGLPVGEYVFDLVMFDASVPPVRVLLMSGRVFVTQGVTGD